CLLPWFCFARRGRHTMFSRDWSSDVCSSDLDAAATYRCVSSLTSFCPHVPVIARARDLDSSERLMTAGAAHAYPEAIEASLSLRSEERHGGKEGSCGGWPGRSSTR